MSKEYIMIGSTFEGKVMAYERKKFDGVMEALKAGGEWADRHATVVGLAIILIQDLKEWLK